ncbi:MAG TPA: hypothetical protein VGJ75_04640 [Dongiaceae bacterium]
MTGGEVGPGPWGGHAPDDLEIVQTRGLTRREANEISRAATIAVARVTLRDPVYWLLLLLLVAGIAATGIGFSHFSYWAWCAGVRFPAWAKVAFFVAIASCVLAGVRRARTRSTLTGQKHAANDRYVIAADGVSIDMQGTLTFLPWRRIHALTDSGAHLFIHLNAAQLIGVTKAAFENQHAECFCAELQRRWQSHGASGLAVAGT